MADGRSQAKSQNLCRSGGLLHRQLPNSGLRCVSFRNGDFLGPGASFQIYDSGDRNDNGIQQGVNNHHGDTHNNSRRSSSNNNSDAVVGVPKGTMRSA